MRQALVKPVCRPLLLLPASSSNLTQDNIPKQSSQAIDGPFDGSNPVHDLRALLQELAQFFVGPAHYFLHVSVFGSDCDWLTLHEQSLLPACGAPRHW
jgi:hypothetical protein